jgi:hypothetical protein
MHLNVVGKSVDRSIVVVRYPSPSETLRERDNTPYVLHLLVADRLN